MLPIFRQVQQWHHSCLSHCQRAWCAVTAVSLVAAAFSTYLCAEMLKYEQEIADLKAALSRAKKISRMWKTRYEAERRERSEYSVAA